MLILGSNRVGKTAFLQQFVHSSFKEEVDVELEKMEETVTVKCCVDQKSCLIDGELGRAYNFISMVPSAGGSVAGTGPLDSIYGSTV